MTKKAATGGNRTVATGISLVKTLATLDGPATLAEIAAAARMLPLRTQRYLKSIVQTGLVSYDGESGRYDLGPAMIGLGLAALARLDAVRLASDALAWLTRETGLVSLLNVWGSGGSTVIKYQQGKLSSLLRVREGSNLPLLTSATGRVFLAYMPSADTRAFLRRERTAWSQARGKFPDAAAIKILCAQVRQDGMARSSGGTGHDALAAPVFDHNGALCFVVTLLSAAGTADLTYTGRISGQLRTATVELSHRLGHRQAD